MFYLKKGGTTVLVSTKLNKNPQIESHEQLGCLTKRLLLYFFQLTPSYYFLFPISAFLFSNWRMMALMIHFIIKIIKMIKLLIIKKWSNLKWHYRGAFPAGHYCPQPEKEKKHWITSTWLFQFRNVYIICWNLKKDHLSNTPTSLMNNLPDSFM